MLDESDVRSDAADEAGAADDTGGGSAAASGFTTQLTKDNDDIEAHMARAYRKCCLDRHNDAGSSLKMFANATERGRLKAAGVARDYAGQLQLHVQGFELHTAPPTKAAAKGVKGQIKAHMIGSIGEDSAFDGHRLKVTPFERKQTVTHDDHGGMLGYIQKDAQLGRESHYTFQPGGVNKAQAEAAR